MCTRWSGVRASSRESRSPGRTCSRPSPSIASTARVSASAIAAAPVSARKCGAASSAVRVVRPRRRCGSVEVAACSAACIPLAGRSASRRARTVRHTAAAIAATKAASSTPTRRSMRLCRARLPAGVAARCNDAPRGGDGNAHTRTRSRSTAGRFRSATTSPPTCATDTRASGWRWSTRTSAARSGA